MQLGVRILNIASSHVADIGHTRNLWYLQAPDYMYIYTHTQTHTHIFSFPFFSPFGFSGVITQIFSLYLTSFFFFLFVSTSGPLFVISLDIYYTVSLSANC